jgi:hypothetical protein
MADLLQVCMAELSILNCPLSILHREVLTGMLKLCIVNSVKACEPWARGTQR